MPSSLEEAVAYPHLFPFSIELNLETLHPYQFCPHRPSLTGPPKHNGVLVRNAHPALESWQPSHLLCFFARYAR